MVIGRRKMLKVTAAKTVTLLVMAAPLTASHGNDLTTLPDWNDEAQAYSSRGLSMGGAQPHIADGSYSANQLDSFTLKSNISSTHKGTEGDDLWTAYQMYKRLDGIHPAAAAEWYERAQSMSAFFKNGYVDGSAWAEDSGFNFDHLYGWGLCAWARGESDTSAIATIDQIVSEMVSWNQNSMTISPGDRIFGTAAGGRRWGRQLRFAVCAAEVSPAAANRAWRDKVIDIVLQAPDWNPTYKMYFLGSQPTNTSSRLGPGAYEAGNRISITYHMGIFMDALWHAWRVLDAEQDSRAGVVRQRLIDMASFYRDIALDANGFLQLNMGYNIDTGARLSANGYGTPEGVYSLATVNGLVMAYKFTGTESFLNRAWTLYQNWQARLSGSSSSLHHFVDSEIASATGFQFLANNKGELQYVYALFENGGNPSLIDGSGGSKTRPLPPSFEVAAAVTTTLDASPNTIAEGQTAFLSWTSANATSCTASEGWSGFRAASGSETIGPLNRSTRFTLTCDGASGSSSDSETVVVNIDSPSGQPTWYTSAADKTWINMTSAAGSMTFQDFGPNEGHDDDPAGWTYGHPNPHEGALRKWCGAVARGDYYVMAFGGGHKGGELNVVYEFGPFSSESPDWHWYGTDPDKYEAPSHSLDWENEKGKGYYSDGKPASRHNYSHLIWVPDLGNGLGSVVFAPWGTGVWDDNAAHTAKAASFRFSNDSQVGGGYEPENTYIDWPGDTSVSGGGGLYDAESGLIWIYAPSSRDFYTFDMASNTYVSRGTQGPAGATSNVAIDPNRRILIVSKNQGERLELAVFDIDSEQSIDGSKMGEYVSPNYENAGWTQQYTSIVFDPIGQKFIGYVGGSTLYTLEPPADYRTGGRLNPSATWTWKAVTNRAGGATPPSDNDAGGIQNRLQYIESLNALAVIVNSGHLGVDSSMYVYKLPSNGL